MFQSENHPYLARSLIDVATHGMRLQPGDDHDHDDSLSHFAEARADAEARMTRAITALEYLPLPLNSGGMMVGRAGRGGA